MSNQMPVYEITTTSGYSWRTSMAVGITLEAAQDYFIGAYFNVEAFPSEKQERAVKVEKIS